MLLGNKCDLRTEETTGVRFDDGQRLARVRYSSTANYVVVSLADLGFLEGLTFGTRASEASKH